MRMGVSRMVRRVEYSQVVRNSALLLLAGAALACTAHAAPPDLAAVRAGFRSSESVLLDRHGEPLHELRTDPTRRRLEWVPLDRVSPALVAAVIAAEDRRFHEHKGVDWAALLAAAWDNLADGRRRGASTITMQLAATLDETLRAGAGGRSFAQKWRQARAALALESRWRKEEILEAYLNLVSWRGELQGVAAAARGLFDKHPGGLDREESALLAALLRAPNAAPSAVARRACAIPHPQGEARDCDRLERLAALHVGAKPRIRARLDAAPHLARAVLGRGEAATVRTTLDAGLQRFARDTLIRHLAALAGRNVEDGAVLVLDNATGDVLAYVASSGDLSGAGEVDGITARRQAGSTLKPFLYADAIGRRLLTAASLLDDAPLHVATPVGLYVPQNYDRSFKGAVSVRTALGASLNVPAVRTLVAGGFEALHERLRTLGLASLDRPAEHYGYALALGGADVSLLELANAYRALANGGEWRPVRFSPKEEPAPGRRALDPGAAFIVGDVLADRGARALTFGLESPLVARSWAAVKTGTSKDMRDNWALGYSDRYTVGVWVGNFSGEPMWDVSGVSGAAPVWQEIMNRLHRGAPSHAPAPPPGVVVRRVRFDGDLEAARDEYFVAGTEMTEVRIAGSPPRARIAYPGEGTIVALDPDIPAAQQRIALRASGVGAGGSWRIDGQPVGDAEAVTLRMPAPGRHRVALLDAHGREVDAVRFEVRGATRQ
jgi:penicillin-binding protein 1C